VCAKLARENLIRPQLVHVVESRDSCRASRFLYQPAASACARNSSGPMGLVLCGYSLHEHFEL
jgi:hypothetical protein